MASTRPTRLLLWLATVLNIVFVQASFWTVTSRYALSISTSYYTYRTYQTSYTYTSTRTVSPGITPASTGIYSSSTYARTYVDLEMVYITYTTGVVDDKDLIPETTYDPDAYTRTTSDYTDTLFVMPVTYTAPSSCPSSFEWSTTTYVYIPTEVIDQITPTSKATSSAHVSRTYTFPATETWYLTAGAAPTSSDDYYYTDYIESCSTPYSYPSATSRSSGGGGVSSNNNNGGFTQCTFYGGCSTLKTWIIVVATILPILFLLGFVESYIWFRRLMIGKGCLRFGTACWVMISPWVACFTRTQSARSKEDQKLLRERWNNVSAGTAFKLWWKWGFRHAYPTELLGEYSRNPVGIGNPGQAWTGQNGQPGQYPPGPPPPGAYPPNGPPPMAFYPGVEKSQSGSPAPLQAYMPPQGYGMPQPFYNQNGVAMIPPQAPVSPINDEGKTISSVSTTPLPNPAHPAPSEVSAVSPPQEVPTHTPAPPVENQAGPPVSTSQELAAQGQPPAQVPAPAPGQTHTGH